MGEAAKPDISFYSMRGANNIRRLEFYNVDELETVASGEHFMCTDIQWDPIQEGNSGIKFLYDNSGINIVFVAAKEECEAMDVVVEQIVAKEEEILAFEYDLDQE
ncbi:hypothetical protein L484_024211 [Morus notabilis]|uniref:Uncharacterized protein n=1 Tax=Morus notabilis TaxID=981085 RepID=W9SBJ7_9ROSA|nr:hypothetical protein L484_024211 [Morus notabilis]